MWLQISYYCICSFLLYLEILDLILLVRNICIYILKNSKVSYETFSDNHIRKLYQINI